MMFQLILLCRTTMKNTKELMYCQCGTHNGMQWWTFRKPWKQTKSQDPWKDDCLFLGLEKEVPFHDFGSDLHQP